VRGEEVEMRHGLVRASYHAVDLVRLHREHRRVATKFIGVRHCPTGRSGLEHESEALDRTQGPRDARREEWVDKPVRVREQYPPLAGCLREPMLDAGHEPDRHDRRRVTEHRADRRIPLEEQCPESIRVAHGA